MRDIFPPFVLALGLCEPVLLPSSVRVAACSLPRCLRLWVRAWMRGQWGRKSSSSAFPREETGAHQLRFFAQSRQFREQLGPNAAPGGTLSALNRTCHSLTLPVCLFPVLQGLFQEWPGSDVGRWVSWLPLAYGCWWRLPLLPPSVLGFLLRRKRSQVCRVRSPLCVFQLSFQPGWKVPSSREAGRPFHIGPSGSWSGEGPMFPESP